MRRGEIWTYRPIMQRPGQALHRLVISATAYNEGPEQKTVITAHVRENDPRHLLAVRVEPVGWATTTVLETTPVRQLGEFVAAITAEEMSAVETALTALLDLG